MKLIGGFVIVALITLIIGAVGFQSITRPGQDIDDIGNTHLKAVEYLKEIETRVGAFRANVRMLLNPALMTGKAVRVSAGPLPFVSCSAPVNAFV